MYRALGDKEAQDEIRLSNPKVQHCFLLTRHSSGSCESLPYEIQGLYPGEVYRQGSVCPNNPYKAKAVLWGKVEKYASVLSMFETFRDVMSVAGHPSLDTLTPEEFVIFKMVQETVKYEDYSFQVKLFNKVFGGSGEK